jgi:hypothetical protein
VFCLGWLEPLPGLLIFLILVVAVLQMLRSVAPDGTATFSPPAFVWLVVLASVWAGLGGAGHFVFANPDWHTRDAVYADLIYGAWPPGYAEVDGMPLVLRSATGFFLVPAALAKLIGIESARYLLFAWSALGAFLFLCLLPLPARFGSRLVLVSLLVVGFSGMDYAAIFLVHGHPPMFPLPLEWWRPWSYTSLTAQLFWAPNHALPLWLGASLLYRHRESDALMSISLLVPSLALLWTPFAIGLLPWAVLFTWQRRRTSKRAPTAAQWLATMSFLVLLLGYLSRPGAEALPFSLGAALDAGNAIVAQWTIVETLLAYVQFIGFEFALLALLLRPETRTDRQALWLLGAILLLLPLFRIGPSNDLLLRMSTPCLVMLLILVLEELRRPGMEASALVRKATLVAVLVIGAITPGFEIARALIWKRTPPNYGQSLVEAQRGYLAPHYLGKLDLPALRVVFKTPQPVPTGTWRAPP